jgi:hypothetical protein
MEVLEKAIIRYLKARKELLSIAASYPDHFSGNDNIIGRIGEYIAIKFLSENNEYPSKPEFSNNKGYDLIFKNKKIQVKVITSENNSGKTVRLVEPWDQFILIDLDLESLTARIGVISRGKFNKAIRDNNKLSKNPIVKRSMLDKNGLIGKYGEV